MKKIYVGLFGFLILLLLLLPAFTSYPPLKGLFLRAVERRVKATVTIDKIHFSWLGPQRYEKIHFSTPDLEGTIDELVSKTPFWNLSSHHSFSFTGGNCQIHESLGSVEQVKADIQGDRLAISGETSNSAGNFLIQGSLSDLSATGARMPSLLLDRLLGAHGYLFTALGPEFDFQGKGTLASNQGRLSIALSSRQANMSLNAKFIPMAAYSLEKLQAQGTLDLGKFSLQEGSSLTSVFQLLKTKGPPRAVNAWVAPINFSIQNGRVQFERFDFLLSRSIHLALWGTLDLLKERIDMMLGIPGDTLMYMFKLPSLSSNFIVTAPVRGSFKNPEVKTGPATAKIAALLATRAIPKAGGLFGLVGANVADESDQAPPSKRPFPWE